MKFLATKDEFDSVLASAGDNLVVVDFTASWCQPCKLIGPQYEVCVRALGFSIHHKVLETLVTNKRYFVDLVVYKYCETEHPLPYLSPMHKVKIGHCRHCTRNSPSCRSLGCFSKRAVPNHSC